MTDSLFDFDAEEVTRPTENGAKGAASGPVEARLNDPALSRSPEGRSRHPFSAEWQEVPQAVFLSWSEARQLTYCAARDIDSAAEAEGLEEIEFYQQRARMYQKMIL